MLGPVSDETNDETNQPVASGNRWEPEAGTPAAEPLPPASPDAPAYEPAAAAPARGPSRLTRARTAVAGVAAAALVAGGLGGFAIGRATAGSDDGRIGQRNGVPTGFDR